MIAKTVVLDPDSEQPILVIVDELGNEVEEIGPQVDPYDTMTIWNADGYKYRGYPLKQISGTPALKEGLKIISA